MSKEEKKDEATVKARLEEVSAALGALSAKVERHSENWKRHMAKYHDAVCGGKVGAVMLRHLLVMAAVFAVTLGAAYAVEEILARWPAPKSTDAVLELAADNEDDTNDELQIIMNTDNDLSITIGGTERLNLTAAGVLSAITGLDFSGDYVGANDETVDNATDSEVRITFDDDAASLGTLRLTSDNAHTNIAANDSFYLKATADNDSNEALDYATLQFKIVDETTNTEDGAVIVKVQANGTDTTIATLDASGLTLATSMGLLMPEGAIQDSKIVSADIKDGEVAAADLASAVQDQVAYITVTGADLASAGTGTITIQAKDAAGNNLSAYVLVRTWIGTADDFGPDALTDYSVSTGTSKEEVTADAEYLAISDANGTIVMAVDNGGAGSVYAWAELGGRIVASGEVSLTAP